VAAAGRKRGAPDPASSPAPTPQAGQPAFFKPSGRLERDTRAETARALGQAEELGLGYGVTAAAAAAPAAAAQQQQQQQKQPQRPAPPPSGGAGQQRGRDARGRAAGSAAAGGGAKKKGAPIILVPAGVSALVNMYNVRQLLEDGVFVKWCGGGAGGGGGGAGSTFVGGRRRVDLKARGCAAADALAHAPPPHPQRGRDGGQPSKAQLPHRQAHHAARRAGALHRDRPAAGQGLGRLEARGSRHRAGQGVAVQGLPFSRRRQGQPCGHLQQGGRSREGGGGPQLHGSLRALLRQLGAAAG
jgi:hypothetical protein